MHKTEVTKHILNREQFVDMFIQMHIYIRLFTCLIDSHLIKFGFAAQFFLVLFPCFKV